MKRLRFPPKLRERLERNNSADRHYAALYGKEPMAQAEIAPKREYKRNERRVSENDVNDAIRNARIPGLTLYRNNRGMVELPNGGKLTYGLGPNGGSDWIGRKTVTVTPAMVGMRIAVFVAVEAKAPDAGPVPDHQQTFIDDTVAAGGIAGTARSLDDLLNIVR